MDKPRDTGRAAIEKSVPADLWKKNIEFTNELKSMIEDHDLYNHPVKALLMQATLNEETTRILHLEFAYAFAQIFTDSLIHAMATSSQLESRLGPLGKVSARFLLQLNLLDELGFSPNPKGGEDYYGNPALAHYVQFAETLRQLNAPADAIVKFRPSEGAKKSRKTFTDYYSDHTLLTCVLAIAETVFTQFAGPWAESVKKSTSIDTSTGYHNIHVENDGHFIDDDHSEDSWYIFRQAVTPERYDEVRKKTAEWLEIWNDFGFTIIDIAQSKMRD